MATQRQVEANDGNANDISRATGSVAEAGHGLITAARLLAVTALLSGALAAQQFRVTADLLSPQTTAAMFGKLPKNYSAANVSVCNQTNAPLTIALSLAAQQTRLSGVVMLPRNAALSVIAAAQGSS